MQDKPKNDYGLTNIRMVNRSKFIDEYGIYSSEVKTFRGIDINGNVCYFTEYIDIINNKEIIMDYNFIVLFRELLSMAKEYKNKYEECSNKIDEDDVFKKFNDFLGMQKEE